MPRYQELNESQLDAEQRRVFNDCKAGPRAAVPPPVHVWLKSPGLADNAHKLGAHVRLGLQAGLSQDQIDAIADRRPPSFDNADDQLVYDFCKDYYDDHRLDDATYERVVARFGDKGIVDLAGLIGYYSFVSVTLNTFEVPTPAGTKLLGK